MGELTLEQRRALALAAAAARAQGQFDPNTPSAQAVSEVASGQSANPTGTTDPMELMRAAGLAGAPDTGPIGQGNVLDPVQGDPTGAAPVVDPVMAYIQGATYGTSDELLDRAVNFAFPNRNEPGMVAGDVREGLDSYRDENPLAAYGLEIAGALSNPLSRLGPWSRGTPAQMAQGAGVGGLLGQLYGMGAAEGNLSERAQDAIPSGLLGGGVGAAAPAVGSLLGRGIDATRTAIANRRAAAVAPSMDEIRSAADALYTQADQAAPLSRPDFLRSAIEGVETAAEHGADPILTPQGVRALELMADSAVQPDPTIGLRELDRLRQYTNAPSGNIANRQEQTIGGIARQTIDDFVDNADPSVSGVLREARDLWGRLRRSEVVDTAIEKAGRGASGFENGLRIEFRRILNNPRLSRGFTQAERDAMEQVIKGTPLGNAMRLLGKFGLDLRQNTNAVGASIGAVTGGMLGGTAGMIALPAVASVSRRLAEKTTDAAARRLQTLIAAGTLPEVSSIAPAIQGLLNPTTGATARVIGPSGGR